MSSMIKRREEGAFFKPPRNFCKRGPGNFPIGKQAKRRAAENRQLNKLPASVKNHCEVRIEGVCVKTIMLTWAHSQKTRFLTTSKDWQEAARCCLPCHDHIEALSHAQMKAIIVAAIQRRKP